MKSRIVILTGKAQSGKDTSCDAIVSYCNTRLGLKAKKYSFARELKEFCINVFGLSRELVYGSDEDKNTLTHIKWSDIPLDKILLCKLMEKNLRTLNDYLTIREFLQVFGTDICRKMFSDCWARSCQSDIIRDNLDIACVSDARFPNEINFFKPQDPLVLKMQRNIRNMDHDSETMLDNYNWSSINHFHEVNNTGTSLEYKNLVILDIFKGYLNLYD